LSNGCSLFKIQQLAFALNYYPIEAVVLQLSISTFDMVFLEQGYTQYDIRSKLHEE